VTKRIAVDRLARWDARPTGDHGDRFLPLPVDRTIELRFDLGDDWDGAIELEPDLTGARVKPVVHVAEAVVERFDRNGLKDRILEAGATYCKAPVVHVVRTVVKRDDRHDVELSLEESIRVFAEETRPADAGEKVVFAVEIAREADGGERE
jgi:hypothetical protein